MKSLIGTDFEWLFDLLQTLGTGNISQFEAAINKHHEYITRFVLFSLLSVIAQHNERAHTFKAESENYSIPRVAICSEQRRS